MCVLGTEERSGSPISILKRSFSLTVVGKKGLQGVVGRWRRAQHCSQPAAVAVWTMWVTVEMEAGWVGVLFQRQSQWNPLRNLNGVECRVSAASWDPAGHPRWARDSPWWGCGLLGKSVV